MMTRIIRRVSLYALTEALEQVKKIENAVLQPLSDCTNTSEQLEDSDPESNFAYLVDLLRTRFSNTAQYQQEEMVSHLFDLVHSPLAPIEPQNDARSRGRPMGSTARRNVTSSNRKSVEISCV
ncbi:hypothetical protein INT47_007339 [Mucor saturninus]|uniref:Uncharacterized protein n=1 Tax=Mucor saturninus TaxID=64648 RepID=A0A8H7R9R8_9FUNG|nr:hypothetical protein INT47_007339 [Mucor saturninus]